MTIETQRLPLEDAEYPSSDGRPMSDNTKQFRWIVTIQGGLDALFRDDPNVFVAGDLLWYPLEGKSRVRRAPDAMVVFGRPKGDRGSYVQFREHGIAPQVVFEVLSPKNTAAEMAGKLQFYDTYGVEEYYLYDPDDNYLTGWLRHKGRLKVITPIEGWTSPRLGVRFAVANGELVITRPDGTRFLTYLELEARREAERERANIEQARADAEQARADAEQARADAEQVQATAERERANTERERAERLAARLRELGIDPDPV